MQLKTINPLLLFFSTTSTLLFNFYFFTGMISYTKLDRSNFTVFLFQPLLNIYFMIIIENNVVR